MYQCKDCTLYGKCKFSGRKETSQICKDFDNKIEIQLEISRIRKDLKEMACEGYDFGINEDFLYLYDVLCYLDNRIAELNMKGE